MFVVSRVAQTMCASGHSVFHYSLSVCWYDWTPLAKVLHVIVGPMSANYISWFAFFGILYRDIIWSGGSTTASTFCYKNGSRGAFLGGQHDMAFYKRDIIWSGCNVVQCCNFHTLLSVCVCIFTMLSSIHPYWNHQLSCIHITHLFALVVCTRHTCIS